MLHKLYSLSENIITELNIEQTDSEYIPYTKEILLTTIEELSADINDVLKKLRKAYNETIDIEDEEEYHRVQSEIREKIRKFRSYNELFSCYHKSVEEYVVIENAYSNDKEEIKPEIVSENSEPEQETIADKSSYFTENNFFNWLVSDGSVSDTTAKIYISNIRSVEKLYQTIYGVRKNILDADSADDVKTTIETLIKNNRYVHANQRRNNSFGYALSKFVQFANISVDGLKITKKTKTYQPPVSTEPLVTKTVDFENPKNCVNSKPCSLIFNNSKYPVKSWCELYTKFLTLLYNDYGYSEILKGFTGKSLCGNRIDFADRTFLYYIRRAVKIANNFYTEGNLSAPAIIKRIKRLMELCSIDNENMIIEYNTHEKIEEDVVDEKKDNTTEEPPVKVEMPAHLSSESDTGNPDLFEPEYIATIKELVDTITTYIGMQKTVSDTRHIVLSLNGNIVRTYNCSDALNKICEFAIRYKPFGMARISGAGIQLNDRNVFYRSNVDGLSNGVQIMRIDNITDLQNITDKIKKYCQIDDDMIKIISK